MVYQTQDWCSEGVDRTLRLEMSLSYNTFNVLKVRHCCVSHSPHYQLYPCPNRQIKSPLFMPSITAWCPAFSLILRPFGLLIVDVTSHKRFDRHRFVENKHREDCQLSLFVQKSSPVLNPSSLEASTPPEPESTLPPMNVVGLPPCPLRSNSIPSAKSSHSLVTWNMPSRCSRNTGIVARHHDPMRGDKATGWSFVRRGVKITKILEEEQKQEWTYRWETSEDWREGLRCPPLHCRRCSVKKSMNEGDRAVERVKK